MLFEHQISTPRFLNDHVTLKTGMIDAEKSALSNSNSNWKKKIWFV